MTINTEMHCRVTAITNVSEKVKRFRFERIDGEPMPIFSGGAHVVVAFHTDEGLRRTPYSLMSVPGDTSGYEISVLRVEQSRGGSHYLHDKLKVGDEVHLTQPVNLFTIDQRGKKHLLFAGGIGITPFMAMMEQLHREGENFELYYAIRDRKHGAYWKELQARYGSRVNLFVDAEKSFIPLDAVLGNQPLGTHLYVCGPAGMIDAVLNKGTALGWPQQNLHFERFLAPPTGETFEVVLTRSNKTITVGTHQSILEAVESTGVEAPYMCRGGACGMCETNVVSYTGTLQHNDIYLEPEDKASGKKIMICVSRIKGDVITLDL
ncbi:MAG: PDR/VanB family oxidoreductase [Hyphomicrobiales bacterium]